MAIDVTLDNILAGFNLSKLNDNFTRIDTALQDGLSRSGTGPNQMLADFDLNSNDILNGGAANFTSITINGSPIFDLTQAAIDAAEAAQAAAEAAQAASEAAATASASSASDSAGYATDSSNSAAASAASAVASAASAAASAASAIEAAENAANVELYSILAIDNTDIAGAGPGGYIMVKNTIYVVNPNGNDVDIHIPAGAENKDEFIVFMMDTNSVPGTVTVISDNGDDIAQDSNDFIININNTGDRFKYLASDTNYITIFMNVLGA